MTLDKQTRSRRQLWLEVLTAVTMKMAVFLADSYLYNYFTMYYKSKFLPRIQGTMLNARESKFCRHSISVFWERPPSRVPPPNPQWRHLNTSSLPSKSSHYTSSYTGDCNAPDDGCGNASLQDKWRAFSVSQNSALSPWQQTYHIATLNFVPWRVKLADLARCW
jgi:hypothetical protein